MNQTGFNQTDSELMDLNKAIDLMGGFGRLQWLATFSLALTRNSGNYFYYTFAYMMLKQLYLCRSDSSLAFASCQTDNDICPALDNGTPIEF